MKKLICVLIFLILILCLCGCQFSDMPTSKFVVIKTVGNSIFTSGYSLGYDKDTKIMYIYVADGNRAGLSPYYIIKDNKAEIAIYGQNYFLK